MIAAFIPAEFGIKVEIEENREAQYAIVARDQVAAARKPRRQIVRRTPWLKNKNTNSLVFT